MSETGDKIWKNEGKSAKHRSEQIREERLKKNHVTALRFNLVIRLIRNRLSERGLALWSFQKFESYEKLT